MTAELRFQLLGSMAITLGGDLLTPMRSRSAEALLIYLALEPKTFSRQVLADFFWDDRSQTQALSNLRTVLAMLRRDVPDHLLITRHSVSFNHDARHWIDAEEFASAQQSPISTRQSPVANFQSVVSLYKGHFLEGFSLPESQGFEAWALQVRERLRGQVVSALHYLAGEALARGQIEVALSHARRLTQMNPLDEIAQRRLIELLWRSGQRSAALQQYEEACRQLARELGVAPDANTVALYKRIRDAPFPPPRRLPAQAGTLVGRERELAQLDAWQSEPQARLINIAGPGGMGKTRLLQEVARRAAAQPGRYMDGVFYIPLVDLSSSHLLPTTLAQVVGHTFQGHADPADQLVAFLRPRELLLALDNVEQLLDGWARRWLARLVREAPDLRLVLSSRVRLGLQEERLLELEGLAVPPAAAQSIGDYPAVRLFLLRAENARPDFSLAKDELPAVAALCRLVQGMPLALELAAAATRYFTCGEILTQLQQQLDWQIGHFPDRPRRHQNLQAVFDHSWRLLDDELRVAGADLSVFAGPFTAQGAGAVAGVSMAQLVALRDQSLLTQSQPGWFDMHPLVRRFLARKLAQDPARRQQTSRAHADYIMELMAGGAPGTNMEQRYHDVHRVMAVQRDQVVAAALRLARRRDFSRRTLVSLVETLIFYYKHNGQYETWKALFGQLAGALNRGQGDEENAAWLGAVFRSRMAEADLEMHAYDRAQATFEAILPQAQRLENGALISYCHHMLGRLATRRADFAAAYDHFAAALPPLSAGEYPVQYFFPVYRSWTEAALVAGDASTAHEMAQRAYDLALGVNSRPEAEPVYAWAMGEISLLEGCLAEARDHLQHAATLADEKGFWLDIVNVAIGLAHTLARLGKVQEAAKQADKAYDLAVKHQDRRLMALAARAQGQVATCAGDLESALGFYHDSLSLLVEIGDEGQRRLTQARLDSLLRLKNAPRPGVGSAPQRDPPPGS